MRPCNAAKDGDKPVKRRVKGSIMAVRKPKAILDLEKQVEKLETDLKSKQSSYEYLSKSHTEMQAELNGLHDILDDLGVRRFRDENKYQSLPLSVRLFAWAMKQKEDK